MSRIPGHEAIVLPPRRSPYESSLMSLADGTAALFHDHDHALHMRTTRDRGRSWDESRPLMTTQDERITGFRTSPVRLKSGKLGLFYSGSQVRPGRDCKLVFRVSSDEGQTWSDGVDVDPIFAVVRSSCGRVLSSGRIIAPVFIWISPYTGGISEHPSHGFCFSWVYYSDDEGQTWNKSLSELTIAKDQGRGGMYQFEEPVVEALKDSRLIMLGRTELGRHYVSYSSDEGISWSTPQPGTVTAAYTPTSLRRIPTTGDLLMIWNQTSAEEGALGLERHRLTCAISKDEGATWDHFRNLESLDDVTQIDPPPAEPMTVHRKAQYQQPTDQQRYPYAPGPLRICYPSITFSGEEAIIVYDTDDTSGYELGAPGADRHTTKLRAVPLEWLYG